MMCRGDRAHNTKGDIKQAGYVLYTWQKQPNGSVTYVETD